jgi:hypothetical protein
MLTLDPALFAAFATMCAGVLMVHAGIAKRQLAWRKSRTDRQRRRRP